MKQDKLEDWKTRFNNLWKKGNYGYNHIGKNTMQDFINQERQKAIEDACIDCHLKVEEAVIIVLEEVLEFTEAESGKSGREAIEEYIKNKIKQIKKDFKK